MRFRQIHLDFHTSEAISNIGASFSKVQFQEMLKLGHVNSVTVFAKCHHGWAYFPSKANETHPGLNFDLLGTMIEAAHEIDVKTPVYISAGLDEKLVRRHPDWLIRCKDEKTSNGFDFMQPVYHEFCMNSPYLDVLISQTEEVVRNYDGDGIFLDIVGARTCYCQNCVSSLRKKGKDPRDEAAVIALGEEVFLNYVKRMNAVIQAINPDIKIFHNSGHIRRGRRDLARLNSHLELESLPTGGWGYDHFPLSARYVQNLGMDYLGMTGKFHTTWGEFGGYKHPNALRYEAALGIANGARISIGDQLHPEGLMDKATYTIIGAAYKEVAAKEEWCTEVTNIADIALLSLEVAGIKGTGEGLASFTGLSDASAVRMLLEGKFLFDVIDLEEDFNKYRVIILPDKFRIDSVVKGKLEDFFKNGGKILATGESGLSEDSDEFVVDLGVKWVEKNPFNPDYFRPGFQLGNLENTAFIFYSQGQKVSLDGGTELGVRENSYFNRDIFNFSSHQHTPNNPGSYGGPGMVESKNGIYLGWSVFEEYATKGSLVLKEVIIYALDRLLKGKTLATSLPAQGIVTLMHQKSQKRFVNHLLYASPVKRGEKTEIIEDLITLQDIDVAVKVPHSVRKVYLAPQMLEIPFLQEDYVVKYTIPKLECHQMVVLDY